MALVKTPVSINFAKGLDTKTDPKQVQIGNFLALQNAVFDKAGGLVKRNGNKNITKLPNALQTTLTTLNDNLTATGSNLYAYSSTTDQWLNRGIIQPVTLAVQSLVRNTTNQTSPDLAVSSTGLACLVYYDTHDSLSYYQITDNVTGQQIISRTSLPVTAVSARVFTLGRYFIITFLATVGGIAHLQYIAVPISLPASPSVAKDISAVVVSLSAGYDAVLATGGNLYFAWAGSSTTVSVAYLTPGLVTSPSTNITSHTATLMATTIDATTGVFWLAFWDSSSTDGYVAAFNLLLQPMLAATQIITTTSINEITASAINGLLTVIYENANTYSYSPNAKTDYLTKITVTQAGTVGSPIIILRSVGLASKAFIDPDSNTIYCLATYGEVNQETYFLIDSSGNIVMRLASGNGGGYTTGQVLSNVTLVDNTYYTPYVIKDQLTAVNKGTDNPPGTPVNALYTQTGVNLAAFQINTTGQYSSEIAGALHLTGGQLWEYDGVKPVEHGFHVYPENIAVTTATGSGSITAQQYYYVFCYEWTDNQGNLNRSAPSIPITITTTTSSSTNTLKVPTLRLTYKITPNPVRIVGYRWSVAQQTYYQFTNITSPVINNPAVDNVTITDTLADSAILGNTLLYTTGGVIENIAAPASIASALYKNRLWLVDAEDPNLLWYSKQVISNTPVELSDLLTLYVAPTSGAQGSTGNITAISAMDDKLIIFKKDAIYYVVGTGPDNTGGNNDFTDPVFITSAVGCANPNSIVLMPNGLMFQSDKGIWLLGRDLNTNYIGAPVEAYNSQTVMKAQTIPATNEVRFVLNNRITLMYDYFYGQWGTFNNISAISATLYQGKDTYLSNLGYIYQETPDYYLDGSEPVLLSFTTGWISLAGIQGFERFSELYFLGSYFTPFKLNVQFAYDYNPSPSQSTVVTPDNSSSNWGGESVWGGGESWGGPGNVLKARVFPETQKCETFQIIVNEVFDPSLGQAPGEGLNLSGMNAIVAVKRGYRTQKASQSFG